MPNLFVKAHRNLHFDLMKPSKFIFTVRLFIRKYFLFYAIMHNIVRTLCNIVHYSFYYVI